MFEPAGPAAESLATLTWVLIAVVVVSYVAVVVAIVGAARPYVSVQAYDRLVTSQRAAATKRLDTLVRKAKAAGVRATAQLVDGNPREAIARAAKRAGADLVVVGTHGRTGLRKLLIGSVAERVVATAPCPVLTVGG